MVFDERTILGEGERDELVERVTPDQEKRGKSSCWWRKGADVYLPNTARSLASRRQVSRDVRALTALVYGSVRRPQEA